jgi:hypothetical protein
VNEKTQILVSFTVRHASKDLKDSPLRSTPTALIHAEGRVIANNTTVDLAERTQISGSLTARHPKT